MKLSEKTELSQISLTGLRALVLLALLIQKPRSLDEIRQEFLALKIIEPEHSNDIIRIDINTLKVMGCEITRANAKTNYKYKLLKHPFSLELTKSEVAVLKRAYNKVKNRSGIELMLKYHGLFNKLAENVFDEDIKGAIYGLSVLKSYDISFIKELVEDCNNKTTLTLIYQNPSAKEASEKTVAAQKVVVHNDSVYLYCFDFKKQAFATLNVKRIKSIVARFLGGKDIEVKTTDVKFLLKKSSIADIEENEHVISETPEGKIILGSYYNDFLAMQRILSFGADCVVLEPESFRENVIAKLKSMRSVYDN